MPELIWKGKKEVVNHHLEVPVYSLDRQYCYPAEESGNRIINGDNLEALKALLPEYEGRVKCIYIDPPYNINNYSRPFFDFRDGKKYNKKRTIVRSRIWDTCLVF